MKKPTVSDTCWDRHGRCRAARNPLAGAYAWKWSPQRRGGSGGRFKLQLQFDGLAENEVILASVVDIDLDNPPSELVLTFNGGPSVYWGSADIPWGANGDDISSAWTVMVHEGALPSWTPCRLSIPASALGLGGATVTSLQLSYVNGAAGWTGAAGVMTGSSTGGSSPMGWWPGEGNAQDALGPNNGDVINGLTYTAGYSGQAFAFDGNGSCISFGPNAGNFGTSDFTIDFWMKTSAQVQQAVLSKRPICNLGSWWDIEMDATGRLVVNLCGDSTGTGFSGFYSVAHVNNNAFHHIVLQRVGLTLTLYVDGYLDNSDSTTGVVNISNTTPMFAGKTACTGQDGTHYFAGILDEVRVTVDTDADHNGLPDWADQGLFGDQAQVKRDTYIDGGNNCADPNRINFGVSAVPQRIGGHTAQLLVDVAAGTPGPGSIAILVDNTNEVGATWTSYTTAQPSVNLGTSDGWHNIYVGLRGTLATSQQTWHRTRVKVDTTPPQLIVTNPVVSTTPKPIIQVRGYCPEQLASLFYDVSNAVGYVTGSRGFVTDQAFDTDLMDYSTNAFQCFDVPLSSGVNRISLHGTDLVGNVFHTNIYYTLNVSSDHTAPVFDWFWPTNGTVVCGSTVTLRGHLDDETATVTVQVNGGDAVTGQMERNGTFWFDNLSLSDGNNTVVMTAIDANQNSSAKTFTMVKSSATFTLSLVNPDEVIKKTTSLTGSVPTGCAVWVNGVQATVADPTLAVSTWTANGVPVPDDGTATFVAVAIPSGSTSGNTAPDAQSSASALMHNPLAMNPNNPNALYAVDEEEKPARLVVQKYYKQYSVYWSYTAGNSAREGDPLRLAVTMIWGRNVGGTYHSTLTSVPGVPGSLWGPTSTLHKNDTAWPADEWPPSVSGVSHDYFITGRAWDYVQGCSPPGVPDPLGTYSGSDIYPEDADYEGGENGPALPGSSGSAVDHTRFSRTAFTIYALLTGGRALIQCNNLFVVSVGSTWNNVIGWVDGSPLLWNQASTGIPWTDLSASGLGPVEADSKVYPTLPSNATIVFDITAAGRGPVLPQVPHWQNTGGIGSRVASLGVGPVKARFENVVGIPFPLALSGLWSQPVGFGTGTSLATPPSANPSSTTSVQIWNSDSLGVCNSVNYNDTSSGQIINPADAGRIYLWFNAPPGNYTISVQWNATLMASGANSTAHSSLRDKANNVLIYDEYVSTYGSQPKYDPSPWSTNSAYDIHVTTTDAAAHVILDYDPTLRLNPRSPIGADNAVAATLLKVTNIQHIQPANP